MPTAKERAIELAAELQHVPHWRRFKRARLWREFLTACEAADAVRIARGGSPDATSLLEILVERAGLEK